MATNDKILEAIILRTLLIAHERGTAWVKHRIQELEGSPIAPVEQLQREISMRIRAPHLNGSLTIGDAVVKAIERVGRCIDARAVLDNLRLFPAIGDEPDERYRRRKISQALYTQKGARLQSVKIGTATVWGLKEWVSDGGVIDPARSPDTSTLTYDAARDS